MVGALVGVGAWIAGPWSGSATPTTALEAPHFVDESAESGIEHTYDFAVHALDAPSGLGPTSTSEEVDAALAASTSVAALTGTYARA